MLYLNVKELLKKKRKTKYWLVQNMHSDYKTISDMMDNKTSGIKFETIEKLCILLDCTPNDIFKFEKEIKEKKESQA
mgnify:CR=1 FL=1